MKPIKFFMLLCASIAFAACSHDDGVTPENGGGETNAGDAWVSLNLKLSPGGTRALNDPDNENGTADETNIIRAKAVFFIYTGTANPVPLAQKSPNDFRVVKVVWIDGEGLSPQEQAIVSVNKIGVPKYVQYVLFIANMNNYIPEVTEAKSVVFGDDGSLISFVGGSTFAELNSAITAEAKNINKFSTQTAFLMTNAKGDLEPSVSATDPALKRLTTYQTSDEAVANPVQITLDRVVAKVRTFFDEEEARAMASEPKPNVYNFGWVINVANTSFYPVSERTKTFRESNAEQLNVWSDPYKLGSYRIDPNYAASINTSDNAQSIYRTYTPDDEPLVWNAPGEHEYCFENTQDKASNMHAYITQVLVKANLAPTKLLLPDNTTYDVAAGEDWLILDGVIYTYEALMKWMTIELNSKYAYGDPAAYPTSMTDKLNQYMVQCGAPLVTLPATATAEEVDALIVTFSTQKDALKAGILPGGNLAYYKGGVNYYSILIQHDRDEIYDNNELGEYSVVRNAVYDINITTIQNPGSPIITLPSPNIPAEESGHAITFEIKANSWTWHIQDSEL